MFPWSNNDDPKCNNIEHWFQTENGMMCDCTECQRDAPFAKLSLVGRFAYILCSLMEAYGAQVLDRHGVESERYR